MLHETKLDKEWYFKSRRTPRYFANQTTVARKVYFPNTDKLVEETCQSCIPCLAATEENVPEALKMSKMPENLMKYLLIFVDYFPMENTYLFLLTKNQNSLSAINSN